MRSFSPGGVNYQIVQGDLVLAKDFIFFYDSGYIPKRKYPQSRMPFPKGTRNVWFWYALGWLWTVIEASKALFFRMKGRRLNWCHLKGQQTQRLRRLSQGLPCLSWAPCDHTANHFQWGGSSLKYRSWFGLIRCITLFIFRWQAVNHSEPDRLGTVRRK